MTQRPRGSADTDAEAEAVRARRPGAPDAGVLAPREAEALEQSVRPVGGRGRGAMVAAGLIVLAFVLGLVRPWDFLGDGSGPSRPVAEASAGTGDDGPATPPPAAATDSGGEAPIASGAGTATAPTCGYPQGWRSATLQSWAGRRARVWSAVDIAEAATGPGDPAIPFNVVAGEDFTAIGWCAPVSGPDRPPSGARGRLYRVTAAGTAEELAHRRLEPPAASALGELWVPDVAAGSSATAWPPGRYVIALATPDGSWSRWLGIELRAVPVGTAGPAPTPTPPPSGGAASPSPVPRSPGPSVTPGA